MSYVASDFYRRPPFYGPEGSNRLVPGWGLLPVSAGPEFIAVGALGSDCFSGCGLGAAPLDCYSSVKKATAAVASADHLVALAQADANAATASNLDYPERDEFYVRLARVLDGARIARDTLKQAYAACGAGAASRVVGSPCHTAATEAKTAGLDFYHMQAVCNAYMKAGAPTEAAAAAATRRLATALLQAPASALAVDDANVLWSDASSPPVVGPGRTFGQSRTRTEPPAVGPGRTFGPRTSRTSSPPPVVEEPSFQRDFGASLTGMQQIALGAAVVGTGVIGYLLLRKKR